MINKFKKTYSTYSIIAFNTLLVFIFLNILAFAGISIYKSIQPPYWPTKSLADLQPVYPGMSLEDISRLMDETCIQPFQYKAFVGFTGKHRTGKFVNISEEGFRYTHIKDLRLDSTGINIYVFGGSTTFGYRVADESTIPAHIQKIYAERYPEKTINVFNFGVPYYYSTQELILLLDLIKNNHIPSIAIFLDGLNEGQDEPFFTKRMARSFTAINYNKFEQLKILIADIPLFRVINHFIKNKNEKQFEEQLDSITTRDNYVTTKKMISGIADSYNFEAYFFIQPVPGYKNRFANHMFMPDDASLSRLNNLSAKITLLEDTVDNINSFSIANLLQDYEKQPFVDPAHYTSEVGKLIAEQIVNKIRL